MAGVSSVHPAPARRCTTIPIKRFGALLMTVTLRHGACDVTWTGSRTEHCPACHSNFSGTTAGDKHRIGPHGQRRCADPASVGLVYDEARNLWRNPGHYNPRDEDEEAA